MMMTFVNMDAPGITILPTHRVVFGLKDFSTADFLAKAEEFFTVTPLASGRSGAADRGGGHGDFWWRRARATTC